jgi:hypothetical protein
MLRVKHTLLFEHDSSLLMKVLIKVSPPLPIRLHVLLLFDISYNNDPNMVKSTLFFYFSPDHLHPLKRPLN